MPMSYEMPCGWTVRFSSVRMYDADKKDIEEIRLTIEASLDVQSGATKELEEKKEIKNNLSEAQKEFFGKTEDLNKQMSDLEKEVIRLTSKKEKCEESIESQINYMWNEYEITLSDAAELRDEEMYDVPAMRREIHSLKDSIRKLGDVNVNAIEDYKNLMERYTFMKTQHDDLIEAEKQLKEIINDLDESMRKQFMEQFKLIKKRLQPLHFFSRFRTSNLHRSVFLTRLKRRLMRITLYVLQDICTNFAIHSSL